MQTASVSIAKRMPRKRGAIASHQDSQGDLAMLEKQAERQGVSRCGEVVKEPGDLPTSFMTAVYISLYPISLQLRNGIHGLLTHSSF